MMTSSWFPIMVVTIVAIAAAKTVITHIVDAIARTKEARLELEREYLQRMWEDLQEIKGYVEELRNREGVGL